MSESESNVRLQCSTRFKYGLNVKYLGHGSGFSVDLRPARIDRLAMTTTRKHFGPMVDELMEVYHRSPMSGEELMRDLIDYERIHRQRISDPVYQLVLETIREDFSGLKVAPFSFEKVLQLPDFPNQKSAGLPYIHQNLRKKRDAIEAGALKDVQYIWNSVGRGKCVHLPDACLFARSQVAKRPKTKIRATWGFPLAVYMEEARFFYPLQEAILNRLHKFPIAYGFEMAKGGMKSIHGMLARHPRAVFTMTDWSKFDKTIPPWLIRDAFAILGDCIDFSQVTGVNGTQSVRASEQIARWSKMLQYFINTPIRSTKGDRFLVSGGVPSGSCWTNILDSVINAIVTRYCIYHTTGSFPLEEMYLGDDGVLVTDGCNLEAMARLANSVFGMVLNTDKSYSTERTDNVHFLGYYNRGGIPFKPQDMLLAQFIHPERPRRKYLETAAAALGQMLASFDPYYASTWFDVITDIARAETREPFTLHDVVDKVKVDKSRFKFLRILGVGEDKISLPFPTDGLILSVLPPEPVHKVARRRYDQKDLQDKALARM